MADAIDDLTDKEKQALRLLLAGHDAKSAALELDISVHTLNDRLRAARRKLGVTTSKEAARALGQAEQSESEPAPQSFVHKPLGVQENPENQHLSSVADRSEGGIIAFAARRKGLLIMSLTLALALTAVAFIPSQNPSATPAVVSDDSAFMAERPSASELQARRFLGLIDFGKFDESYAEAG
ncbi:MAG: helix-turn-helix transcriptional regulator, partial [Pseudomonadota bacterium]